MKRYPVRLRAGATPFFNFCEEYTPIILIFSPSGHHFGVFLIAELLTPPILKFGRRGGGEQTFSLQIAVDGEYCARTMEITRLCCILVAKDVRPPRTVYAG